MKMKINAALVGLGFGGAFAEIYRDHPNVGEFGIFDTDARLLDKFARRLGPVRAYESFEQILDDPGIDAVHLVTPIPLHAEQAIKVLKSGKHCACTVPMATSLGDIQRITDAVRESGKKYMMMETTLYTYQFLYVKEMVSIECCFHHHIIFAGFTRGFRNVLDTVERNSHRHGTGAVFA
jgi:predicted dehydrogenase